MISVYLLLDLRNPYPELALSGKVTEKSGHCRWFSRVTANKKALGMSALNL